MLFSFGVFYLLWFLTGTDSDFPMFRGRRGFFCLTYVTSMSVFRHTALYASPVEFSRHENRAQIQAVTILHFLTVCLDFTTSHRHQTPFTIRQQIGAAKPLANKAIQYSSFHLNRHFSHIFFTGYNVNAVITINFF